MSELLTIKHDPKGILKTPCKPVKTIGVKVKSVADDLVNYLYDHRGDDVRAVSLAAPQLGLSIRVIAFYPNHRYLEKDGIEVLINPEITSERDFIVLSEYCLSIPKKEFTVRRAKSVKVKGLTLEGRPKSYKAAGLLAQALQHEINHLDGILISEIGELVG